MKLGDVVQNIHLSFRRGIVVSLVPHFTIFITRGLFSSELGRVKIDNPNNSKVVPATMPDRSYMDIAPHYYGSAFVLESNQELEYDISLHSE